VSLGRTPRDAANMRLFLRWMVIAMSVYLVAAFAVRHRSATPAVVPWALLLAATALSMLAVRRYLIYLREADELVRKIEVEALAVGFGAGALLSLILPLAAELGLHWIDEYVIATAMMLSWSVASFLGHRRFGGGDEP